MRIYLQSDDVNLMRKIESELPNDLDAANLSTFIEYDELQIRHEKEAQRGGEVVTLAIIALAAVSPGGALTVALGKEGFLTRLARALETYIDRKIEASIETSDGKKIKLSGTAGAIRKILEKTFKHLE